MDMMEDYFVQSEAELKADIHPELMYQVGATPSFVEQAREHCSTIAELSADNKPLTICPPEVCIWMTSSLSLPLPPHTDIAPINYANARHLGR